MSRCVTCGRKDCCAAEESNVRAEEALRAEIAQLRAELAAGAKLMAEATEWACDDHPVATVCRACGAIWSRHEPDCALVAAEEWAARNHQTETGGAS